MTSSLRIPPTPPRTTNGPTATMPRSAPPPPPPSVGSRGPAPRINPPPPPSRAAPPIGNKSAPPPPTRSSESSDSKLRVQLHVVFTYLLCLISDDFENRFRFRNDFSAPEMWRAGPKTYPSQAAANKAKSEWASARTSILGQPRFRVD